MGMTKTEKAPINDKLIGQIIKVASVVHSDGSVSLVPAHTKKAAPARVTGIERAGRYVFIDTDMGGIMIGAGGKVTVVTKAI